MEIRFSKKMILVVSSVLAGVVMLVVFLTWWSRSSANEATAKTDTTAKIPQDNADVAQLINELKRENAQHREKIKNLSDAIDSCATHNSPDSGELRLADAIKRLMRSGGNTNITQTVNVGSTAQATTPVTESVKTPVAPSHPVTGFNYEQLQDRIFEMKRVIRNMEYILFVQRRNVSVDTDNPGRNALMKRRIEENEASLTKLKAQLKNLEAEERELCPRQNATTEVEVQQSSGLPETPVVSKRISELEKEIQNKIREGRKKIDKACNDKARSKIVEEYKTILSPLKEELAKLKEEHNK